MKSVIFDTVIISINGNSNLLYVLSSGWSEYFGDTHCTQYSGQISIRENVYIKKVEFCNIRGAALSSSTPGVLILLEKSTFHNIFSDKDVSAIYIKSEAQLVSLYNCLYDISGYRDHIILTAYNTFSLMKMTNFINNGEPYLYSFVQFKQLNASECNISNNYMQYYFLDSQTMNLMNILFANNSALLNHMINAYGKGDYMLSSFVMNQLLLGNIFNGNIELKNCVVKDNDCFGHKLAFGTIKFDHCVVKNNNASSPDTESLTFVDNMDSLDFDLNLFPLKDCFHMPTMNGNSNSNNNNQFMPKVVCSCNNYFNYGLLHRVGYTLTVISLS